MVCSGSSNFPFSFLMSFSFVTPVKSLFNEKDLEEFKTSKTYAEIVSFVKSASEAVVGKKISSISSDDLDPICTMAKFKLYIDKLMELVIEIPPLQQPMRYGNKAFRTWHSRMQTETQQFLSDLLPDNLKGASVELSAFLNQSYGNETRIDYGTGHELSLFLFFLGLHKLELLSSDDLSCMVLLGFSSYIRLMRRLQETYMLEPAGSHGVWGLDDYHCLAFVFGAAQLVGQEEIKPGDIHNQEVLREGERDFFYLECISFIRRIKSRAPFSETSPMLNDISAQADWSRVYAGLIRLFQGEVLSKLPAVQHLLFGSLISCSWTPHSNQAAGDNPHLNPTHRASHTHTVVGLHHPANSVANFTSSTVNNSEATSSVGGFVQTRAPWAT